MRILRALCSSGGAIGLSGRDLARRAGVSHPRANEVLDELAEIGLATLVRLPRTDLFALNRDHVLAGPVLQLFEHEPRRSDLMAFVAESLRALGLPVTRARLFGSAARGDMGPASDVDLALICNQSDQSRVEAAVEDLAAAARQRFGVRLNVIVGSPDLATLARKTTVWRAIEAEGVDLSLAGARARAS